MTDAADKTYPIGTPGQPWTEEDRKTWLAQQSVQRSYGEMVLDAIEQLASLFTVDDYGHLDHDADRYPLFALRSRNWQQGLPTILVTGGVHGYETSGVLGALRFLESSAQQYENTLNLVVAPCVSPWAFETINRWNVNAIDPNRSFYDNSPAQESASLMRYVAGLDTSFALHIDLHAQHLAQMLKHIVSAHALDPFHQINGSLIAQHGIHVILYEFPKAWVLFELGSTFFDQNIDNVSLLLCLQRWTIHGRTHT